MPSEFHYQPLFEFGADETPYRKLTSDGVSTLRLGGRDILQVEPEVLRSVARAAFDDVAHLLRPGHLAQLRSILDDPEASANDRFVALELLRNANVAAGRVLPGCQDTGTAIVMGHKGERVLTAADDRVPLSQGIFDAYAERNLRYSQMAPLDMYTERNTGSNLPAQIEIYAEPGDEYELLFIAKGGGSGQQDVPLPGDEGAAQPGVAGRLRRGEAQDDRHGGLPALPSGAASSAGRRRSSRSRPSSWPRRATWTGCPRAGTSAAGRSATSTWSGRSSRSHGGSASGRSSAASTSPTTCASSACRGTAPRARSASGCRARPTGRRWPRSRGEGVFLEQLEENPARFLPDVSDEELPSDVVRIDLNRPTAGHPRRADEVPPWRRGCRCRGP